MKRLIVGDTAPNINAQDARSNMVDLEKLTAKGPVLILFVRHLGCPLCREIISELSTRYDKVVADGGRIIGLTESTPTSVRKFVEKRSVGFSIISDKEKKFFTDYGVGIGSVAAMLGPKVLGATVRATIKGHMHGPFEGNELQLPADFIVGKGNEVLLAHYGKDVADHLPVDKLIEALR